jgi:hypothetical protein
MHADVATFSQYLNDLAKLALSGMLCVWVDRFSFLEMNDGPRFLH